MNEIESPRVLLMGYGAFHLWVASLAVSLVNIDLYPLDTAR